MQVVTDDMWAGRSERFPEETPSTKEYYLLRSIFEEHFPSQSALDTVPKVYISHLAGITLETPCRLLGCIDARDTSQAIRLQGICSVYMSLLYVSQTHRLAGWFISKTDEYAAWLAAA